MQIRATTAGDLEQMSDVDGTIDSTHYLHVEKSGDGLSVGWQIERRALREKLIDPGAMDDELRFLLKQVVAGAEEGLALVAEHENVIVASAVAQVRPEVQTLKILDLRVDYDYRRQGLGSALLYRIIQEARERGLRAVAAETKSKNAVAAQFLSKAAFDLAGLDLRRRSNHDLVKEEVTLFWYAALD